MFRDKMDLMLKICLMPFTEYEFYKKDHIEKLAEIIDIKLFRKYFYNTFIPTAYRAINKRHKIHNLDEINLLFDKFYPKSQLNRTKDISKYYINLLSKLSKSFICHRNGKMALKYWESDGEEDIIGPYKGLNKIILWNSLNRMFTTELLVIRYLLDNNMGEEEYLTGYYSSIMLEDLQLEQVLKRGVAETHIHKGAGINFYISWQDNMTLTGKTEKSFKERFYTNYIVEESYGLEHHVKAMAIVRVLMAHFLELHKCQHECKLNFEEYLKSEISNEELLHETKNNTKNNIKDKNFTDLLNCIFSGKSITNDDYKFFDLWDRLKEKGIIPKEKQLMKNPIEEEVLKSILYSASYIKSAPENIFLFMCMKYMDEFNDYFFNKIFWQYIRIKNETFQLKVQGNMVKGLLNFKNYYDRSTEISGYTGVEYWKLIMLNQFQNSNLKKLELRTSFGKGKSIEEIKRSIKKTLISFFKAYINILEDDYTKNNEIGNYLEAPRVGLVFHFIKMADPTEYEKCWQNYSSMDQKELYFRELQDNYIKQVQGLNELREEITGLSDYILGIDAASIENSTEPWVFAPVYEIARDSSTHKSLYLNNCKKIKNLGFTFHVGEDFRHLLTGLRRIDEVVENFKFHAGDRIGHGIALGVNVDKWIAGNRIVILPRIEYVENLLWLWGLYKDGKHSKSFDIGYLEQAIMTQAKKIYIRMEGITTFSLWRAYKNKFSTFNLYENFNKSSDRNKSELFCTFVDTKETLIWNEERLTHAQHCRCYLERMLKPIQIEINEKDAEMLAQVQKIVSTKISKEGIIVETNPTSNVAIGEIENIFEHYIHNLNGIGLNTNSNTENSVMISINSDDPSVFNTNVSNEFAYIFYSLQERGYSREDALIWIDKVRRYGMDSSFIDDRKIGAREVIGEVRGILGLLEH